MHDLKSLIRSIPDYPKQGIMFRDVTTLLGDARGFKEAIAQMAAPFAAAAARIATRHPGWQFLAPMASSAAREAFLREVAQVPDVPAIRVLDGQAQRALQA